MNVTTCALNGGEDQESISVDVTNEGDRDGDAVIQVYAESESAYAPLHPRLCGFCRVTLAAGETRRAEVPLDRLTRTVVNDRGERVPAGPVNFHVGLNQPDPLSVRLTGLKPVVL